MHISQAIPLPFNLVENLVRLLRAHLHRYHPLPPPRPPPRRSAVLPRATEHPRLTDVPGIVLVQPVLLKVTLR